MSEWFVLQKRSPVREEPQVDEICRPEKWGEAVETIGITSRI